MKSFMLSKGFKAVTLTLAAICCLLVLSGSGRNAPEQDASTPIYPHVVASVHLTNLTAAIPTTGLYTPAKTGLYRVSAYLVTTVPVASDSGGWQLDMGWADDAGQEQLTDGPVTWAYSTPPYAYSYNADHDIDTFTFRANAGTPITYGVQVTGGETTGSTYELYFTVEQLQ